VAAVVVAFAAAAFLMCVSSKGRAAPRLAHPDRISFGDVYGRGPSQGQRGSFQPYLSGSGQAVEMSQMQQLRRSSLSLASPSSSLSQAYPHRSSSVRASMSGVAVSGRPPPLRHSLSPPGR
jgi:hypothetical protein